jgi:pyrroline-5-carboxylate reductase
MPNQTVISIAAGVSTARLEACFDADVPVVRVMPNTPALVGAAATALSAGKHASTKELALARRIFDAVGTAIEVDENCSMP